MSLPSRRLRVGCDVVELAEIANSLSTFGQRYLDRIFTETEIADCTGPTRVHRLAARFAAKEAAVKAFAVPESSFVPREIEVVMIGPVPTLRLSGAAADLAADQGWTDVSLSLSHADCHAAAVVVAICPDEASAPDSPATVPRSDERIPHVRPLTY